LKVLERSFEATTEKKEKKVFNFFEEKVHPRKKSWLRLWQPTTNGG